LSECYFVTKCKITLFSRIISSISKTFSLCDALSQNGIQRGGGFAQAGVPQRFGRATNFQIPAKLSAGIHPRLRETARKHEIFKLHTDQ